MATYIPNATDGSEPVDSQKASTMGLEFRTLKTYIQSVILPLINSKAPSTGEGTSGSWPITADWATNANNVMNFAGEVRTGVITVASSSANRGYVQISQGDGVFTGLVSFYRPDGARKAYMGYGSTGVMQMVGEDGSIWQFNTAISVPHVYGNIDSANTVPWTGVSNRPTKLSQFENDIGAGGGGGGGTPAGVSSFNTRTGGVILQNSDVITAIGFSPYNSTNPAGYTTLAGVSAAGYQTSSGTVQNAMNVINPSSNAYGTRTISTAPPSGGNNGDIWYVV